MTIPAVAKNATAPRNIRVRIYEDRVAGALEHFLNVLYREPWTSPEEMIPHSRWEALQYADHDLRDELHHLWWQRVALLISEWAP